MTKYVESGDRVSHVGRRGTVVREAGEWAFVKFDNAVVPDRVLVELLDLLLACENVEVRNG